MGFEFSLPKPIGRDFEGLSTEAINGLGAVPSSPRPVEGLVDEDLAKLPGVEAWAKSELEGVNGAFAHWDKYADVLGQPVPRSIAELSSTNPSLGKTLLR